MWSVLSPDSIHPLTGARGAETAGYTAAAPLQRGGGIEPLLVLPVVLVIVVLVIVVVQVQVQVAGTWVGSTGVGGGGGAGAGCWYWGRFYWW